MFKIQNSSNKQHLSQWPLWTAIGFPVQLIALEATPLSPNFVFVMMGIPALLLAWAVLGVLAAILAVRWLRQRAWKQAMIGAVLPLVVLIAGLRFITFVRFCSHTGDTIRFYVNYPSYSKAVHATPSDGQPRLLTFNLGGMIWASRGFVYDESDEALREPSMQSSSWKARAQKSELGCGYGAIPMPDPFGLGRHWYIASFAC